MGAGSLWGVDPDAQPKREPGEGLSQGASLHYFLGLHFAPLFMEGHFQIYQKIETPVTGHPKEVSGGISAVGEIPPAPLE